MSSTERILSAYVNPSWGERGDEASRYKAARAAIEGGQNLKDLPALLLVQALEKLKTKALGAQDLVGKLDTAFCLKFKDRPATQLTREEMQAAVTFFKVHSKDLESISKLTLIPSLKAAYLLTHPEALKNAGKILNKNDIEKLTNGEITALLDRSPPFSQEIIPLLSQAVNNKIDISTYLHNTAFPHIGKGKLQSLVGGINWDVSEEWRHHRYAPKIPPKEANILAALEHQVAVAFDDEVRHQLPLIQRGQSRLSVEQMGALNVDQTAKVIKALAHHKEGLKEILLLYKAANNEVREAFPRLLTAAMVTCIGVETARSNLPRALREVLKGDFEKRLIPLLLEVAPGENIYSYLPFFLYGAQKWYEWGDPYVTFMEKLPVNDNTEQLSNCLEALHYLYGENRLHNPHRMIKAIAPQMGNHHVPEKVRADWMLTGLEAREWSLPTETADRQRALFFIFNNASHPEKAIQMHLDSIDDLSRYLNNARGLLPTVSAQFAGALVAEITKRGLPLNGGIVELLIRAKHLQMTPQIIAYFRKAYPRLLIHEIREKIDRIEHYRPAPKAQKLTLATAPNRQITRLQTYPHLVETRWVTDLIPVEDLQGFNESDMAAVIGIILKTPNAEQQLEALFKIVPPRREDLILESIDQSVKKIASPALDLYLSPYEQKHLSPQQIAHVLEKLAPHKKGLEAATSLLRNRQLKKDEVAQLATLLHGPYALDFAKKATLELFYFWRNQIDHNLLHPQIKEGIIDEMLRRGREDKAVNEILRTRPKITDYRCPIEAKIALLVTYPYLNLKEVLKSEEIQKLDHYQRLALTRAFIDDNEHNMHSLFTIGFPEHGKRLQALLECYRDLNDSGRHKVKTFVMGIPGDRGAWQKELEAYV